MSFLEAFILGLIQGLTEFLPVSSSGHIELGKAVLGVEIKDSLSFTIVVHTATVLSTIFVFRKEIGRLVEKSFALKWNTETQYIAKILLSAIPAVIAGLFFEDYIEQLFNGRLILVGSMLLVTATLLTLSYFAKTQNKDISFKDAFIIGIAQMLAIMPGISRSGATISTALLLRNKRTEAAKFSFLMVLIPILGKAFLDILGGEMLQEKTEIMPLLVGFFTAFVSGLLACKVMIAIVKNSKLIYFAIYCVIIGIITIMLG